MPDAPLLGAAAPAAPVLGVALPLPAAAVAPAVPALLLPAAPSPPRPAAALYVPAPVPLPAAPALPPMPALLVLAPLLPLAPAPAVLALAPAAPAVLVSVFMACGVVGGAASISGSIRALARITPADEAGAPAPEVIVIEVFRGVLELGRLPAIISSLCICIGSPPHASVSKQPSLKVKSIQVTRPIASLSLVPAFAPRSRQSGVPACQHMHRDAFVLARTGAATTDS
jgi:hypothetical protein